MRIVCVILGMLFSALVYQVARAKALEYRGFLVRAVVIGVGPYASVRLRQLFGDTEFRFCMFPVWVWLDVSGDGIRAVSTLPYFDQAGVFGSGILASLVVSVGAFALEYRLAERNSAVTYGLIIATVFCAIVFYAWNETVSGIMIPLLWIALIIFFLDDVYRGEVVRGLVFSDTSTIFLWLKSHPRNLGDILSVIRVWSFVIATLNLLPMPFFDGHEIRKALSGEEQRDDRVNDRREFHLNPPENV